jgi:acyl-CoA thioesterase FadM
MLPRVTTPPSQPNGADRFARAALLSRPLLHRHLHRVRFQEIDAAGIVFFARVFDLIHDGYAAFLAARGLPLGELLARSSWVLPLAHAEADFLRPLKLDDELAIGPVCAAFDKGRLELGHRVVLARDDTAAAIGRTAHVVVARADWKKIEPPPELRAAFADLIG